MPEIIAKTVDGQTDIARIVEGYRDRSERARRSRVVLNRENWDLYHGRQDWSHKQKHQSREFLPDLPMAIEQIAGVIEKALSDQSDWFDVEPLPGIADDAIQRALLDSVSLRKLLAYCLSRLYTRGNYPETGHNFALLMADAVKMGLIEAVIVLKVYGMLDVQTQYGLETVQTPRTGATPDGEQIIYTVATDVVRRVPVRRFRLAIDLIPWEDFFPDPSGMNLYDIHEVTRPIHELRDNPAYDPEVIDAIENQARQEAEAARAKRDRGGEDDFTDDAAPTVRVRECWGDLIDPDSGRMLQQNVLVTTVGTRLLRPPQENPLWHGRRPFVKAPLIRVPLSTVHKAILDHAGPMARLMNELTNLMIDGGFAATWGTRQVRPDLMETPEEISDGIPQGYTAVLKPGVPENTKFLERVDEGQVPEFAAVMLTRIERSFQVAMATPDLKLGVLPPRQVKACVPMSSEALTRDGWRTYHELQLGQEILALDPATGALKWTPILALYQHDAAETVEYRNAQWRVVCTPNHKWVTQQYDYRQRTVRDARTLQPLRDATGGTVIQTTTTEPAPDGAGLVCASLPDLLSRSTLVPDVLQMTSAQRTAFIVGMLAGEGFKRNDGSECPQIIFTQKAGPVFDAFRLACFLEGIRTSATTNTVYDKRNGQTYTKRHAMLFYHPAVWACSLVESPAGTQPVWCPQTQYKTWVMRQGDVITLTGNTEIVEASQASSGLFESLIAHGENGLVTPTLELAWLTIWQYLDSFTEPELVQILGPDRAALLQALSPAARFVRLAQSVRFRVTGLRATVGRMQEYQKLMALLQSMAINPAFAAAFDAKYSIQKYYAALMKSLGLDPTTLEKPEGAPAELNPALLTGTGGGAGGTGGPESEIEAGYAAANPEGQRGVQFP